MTSDDERLQAQYDGIPVPCYTWRRHGGEFVLERANRAAAEIAAVELSDLVGKSIAELCPARPDFAEDLRRCVDERRDLRREHIYRLRTTGEARRIDVTCVYVAPDRVMVHADDITELRETEERLHAVIATLEVGLVTIDLDGLIADANPAACTILGLPEHRLIGDPDWYETLGLRNADGGPRVRGLPGSPGSRALRDGESIRDMAVLATRPDGSVIELSVNYEPLRAGPDGEIRGVVLAFTDLSEQRRLQTQLVQQALHDPLTGLPNRLLFQERLERTLARPLRSRVAVLVIGLDRFRAVNDTHGHATGDEILVQVAARLRLVLDVSQPLARFGGDEFVVAAELDDEREAAALAQRLAGALEDPFLAGQPVFVTAAIGIAVEDPEHGSAGELVQGADAAMQRVKTRGGAGAEVFDSAMGGRLRDRMRIEDGLRRALERGELRLHYQPIVRTRTGAVVAVEALVRWQHPEQGLLAPGRFLPVAEQHGRLMSAIGDWVLRQACAEIGLWPPELLVSVNVAARELGEDGFAERIAGTIADAGVPPTRIALEITETTLMQGGQAAIAGLASLAELGVQVYLDDFGTGYSSLTRLTQLPLTGIKLDRGFVARALGERDRRIMEAALSVGRAAELIIVAEGVETEDQLALLQAFGCHFVQGYLLGRPAPPEQVIASLH